MSQARKRPVSFPIFLDIDACFSWDSWLGHRLLTMGGSRPDNSCGDAGSQLGFMGDVLPSTFNLHVHAYSSVDIAFQDTKWSLYVGREFCTTSSVNSEAIPVPFVAPELDPYLGCWPPKENEPANHISGTFAATCSLMQIAREVADAVYV